MFVKCFNAPLTAPTSSNSAAGTSTTSVQLEQLAYIKASNPGAGDQFGNGGELLGNSISLSGDGSTLAVGAFMESSGAAGINGDQDDDLVYGAGAVYVYARNGNTWEQQAYIKASNPGDSDNFGYVTTLSADGDTLVECGSVRERVSQELARRVFDAVKGDSLSIYFVGI